MVHTQFGQAIGAGLGVHQAKGRGFGGKELSGMGFKGDDAKPGWTSGEIKHRSVAQMHTVKIAHGAGGAASIRGKTLP